MDGNEALLRRERGYGECGGVGEGVSLVNLTGAISECMVAGQLELLEGIDGRTNCEPRWVQGEEVLNSMAALLIWREVGKGVRKFTAPNFQIRRSKMGISGV